MDSLSITDVDSDVGNARTAIGVVDQVPGLCGCFRDGVAKRHVVSGPAMEVDPNRSERVGDQCCAVLSHAELGEGGRRYRTACAMPCCLCRL
jgi:hypothetical protein